MHHHFIIFSSFCHLFVLFSSFCPLFTLSYLFNISWFICEDLPCFSFFNIFSSSYPSHHSHHYFIFLSYFYTSFEFSQISHLSCMTCIRICVGSLDVILKKWINFMTYMSDHLVKLSKCPFKVWGEQEQWERCYVLKCS